ncbi:hypothetical protein BRETT_000216 [Brettanomyces bruxellensis]|uniref:Uncharacterized protein n=1 Tax=Dekkera bruxellensis TaxID=5007 RepID=A0A871R470_DEKBR|nr:uncharacterized protein BRETT_000216 [Brettanomyces bruxellensis]QOU18488.1 hypothetical protein BRETT_000216 [Brettanomyces bruxellensis]
MSLSFIDSRENRTPPTQSECIELIRILEFNNEDVQKIFNTKNFTEPKRNSLFFILKFKRWFCQQLHGVRTSTTEQIRAVDMLFDLKTAEGLPV